MWAELRECVRLVERTMRDSLGSHEQRSLTILKIARRLTNVLVPVKNSYALKKRLQCRISDPELRLCLLLLGDLLTIVILSLY